MRDVGEGQAVRVARAMVFGACLVVLAACGGNEEAPRPAVPDLAALQALEDDATLDAALAAWPIETQRHEDPTTAQQVLTWRLRRHAAAKRIEAARADLALLRAMFEGDGRTVEGRTLPEDLLAAGLTEAALGAARERMEGTEPDREGATRALAIADELDDGELAEALEGTTRWCEAERLDDLGLELPDPGTPQPRVVLLADTFALGPATTLPAQLARWRRDATDAHIEVVPLTRGFVMAGIRRVPTRDPRQEVEAIRTAVATAEATIHPAVKGARIEQALALGGSDAAILVLDGSGRIVARGSGAHLDLQRLEAAWQRLTRR